MTVDATARPRQLNRYVVSSLACITPSRQFMRDADIDDEGTYGGGFPDAED